MALRWKRGDRREAEGRAGEQSPTQAFEQPGHAAVQPATHQGEQAATQAFEQPPAYPTGQPATGSSGQSPVYPTGQPSDASAGQRDTAVYPTGQDQAQATAAPMSESDRAQQSDQHADSGPPGHIPDDRISDDPVGHGRHHRRRDYRPTGVAPHSGLFATLKRTFTEASEDNLTDWAAALTYYGVLAMFPALIALVSVIGLFADPASTTQKLTEIVNNLSPGTAGDTLAGPIQQITSNRTGAGLGLVIGLAAALWSASGFVGAFIRASNIIYETPEGRPIWKLRPLQLLVTLIGVVLTSLVLVSLVATGPVVDAIAAPLGLGSTAVTVWNIAKWPVLVIVVLVMITVLYYAAPNVRMRKFQWVTAGSLFALLVWALASAAFAFYVANFGSYNKTYGALAGVVVFLVWLWLTNLALLLGMQLNAERERSLEMAEGVPGAEVEIQLDARDKPKARQTT
jgi:membrane protein